MYILSIDIYAAEIDVTEEKFKRDVNSIAPVLHALTGAFGRDSCEIVFYPPYTYDESNPNYEWWSARCVVLVSVGKKRAECLISLYQAIARLIGYELPDYEMHCSASEWKIDHRVQ